MPNYDINNDLAGVLPAGGIADLRELISVQNTDNTSDASKPVSTATQTALNLKANLASPNFSGVPTLASAPLATQQYVLDNTSTAVVNKYSIHSAFGEGLIDMTAEKGGKGTSGANIFYFSTNKTSDIIATITATGATHILPILANGTTGTQVASGAALAFHPGGEYTDPRATGIMSVASGATTRSGAITEIIALGDGLTHISISGLSNLENCQVDNNMLTDLNVNANTALTTLSCQSNQLATLDISANTALVFLYCDDNQLATLDISANTVLTVMSCSSNQLTALDVSANTALESMSCNSNQLTSLDVSTNTALNALGCNGNQLTTLDVGANVLLVGLFATGNALTVSAVNVILQDLDAAGLTDGEVDLSGGTNAAPTGAGATAKTNLQGKGWTVTTN